MQLTIDSTEPLEHVLRVVGSLYGTDLAAAPTVTAAAAVKSSAKPARSRKRSAATSRSRHRTRSAPSTAEVRAWAQGQGYQVAGRGQLPGNILSAYTVAHP